MPVSSKPVWPASSLAAGAIALPFSRSPIWHTVLQESIAGVEVPLQLWSYPRYRYKMTVAMLREAAALGELQLINAFYNQVGGRFGVFQYDDPHDNTTAADQSFGTGNGSSTQFQLVRSRGGFVEPVFAVNTITNLKKAGVPLSSPTDYSVSVKGLITFVSPPAGGAALTWTGTYLWFCRFDQDEEEFKLIIANALTDPWGPIWAIDSLSFTTVKFGS